MSDKFTCAGCQKRIPSKLGYQGVHWGFMGEYDPTYMGMCYSCARKSLPKGRKPVKFDDESDESDFLNLFPKSSKKKR